MTQKWKKSGNHNFFSGCRLPVFGRYGCAATSHPLASAEALSVLRAGGSAADACIAACAVLCVVEPHMTGIGGDCFALVKPADSNPIALNGSGFNAADITSSWLKNNGVNAIDEDSALAVTIPGAISAWSLLHRRYGVLPWRGLFQSAIIYAQKGYPLSPRVASDWLANRSRIEKDIDARDIFLPSGRVPSVGSIHKQPALAATLRTIADQGSDAFYRGDIAKDIVSKLNRCGAPHHPSDFEAFSARWETPVHTSFRDWRIWECAPNSQGMIALFLFALLDKNTSQSLDIDVLSSYLDIVRRVYTWRDNHLGDISANWQAIIDDVAHSSLDRSTDAIPIPPPEHKDTVYLSAIDSKGLSVSFINSLFHPFGSGIVAPKTGILLHNRGLSFSLQANHPNEIAAHKRPMHTIIPAIADSPDGDTLSFGVMGGHYQAAGQAWFLSRFLDDHIDLQQALDMPRLFNYPNVLEVEPTFAKELRNQLASRFSMMGIAKEPIGGGQAVMRTADGVYIGASDSRKDGFAIVL